ncbi:Protein argonaute 1B [Lachnellula suecica]|uniref:Protein argonaute 1B n=1 Tax=Lachnellula suecica TaxID=602035 RepID=A0A8T9C3A6_9HELO|nr:Protein argonaute 1B [Lachnellula suecica]
MSGQGYRGRGGGGGGFRGGGDRGGGGFRGGRGGGGGGRGGGPAPKIVFRDPSTPLANPDTQVMNIENAYMKNASAGGLQQAMANMSLTSEFFPPRPGHGTQGKKIVVYANYFKVMVPPALSLTRYSVEVQPEVTGKKLGRVFQLLLGLPEFAGSGLASDMRSMIVAKTLLPIPNDYSVQIPYLAEGQDEPLARAVTYTVRIITPLTFSISDLAGFLSSVNPNAPPFTQKAEAIQVLNVLFGHYPQAHNGTVSIGQNRHFSIDRSQSNAQNITILGGGLESLRGYFQSVRPATGGLLLNVNVTHGVFLEPIKLDQLLPKLGSGNKITLQKKLKLVRVEVTHLPPKIQKSTNTRVPRVKTIFGLAHQQDGRGESHPPKISEYGAGPKGVSFWLAEVPPAATGAKPPVKGKAAQKGTGPPLPSNTYITVFDFFRKKYPKIPLNERLPVVNVGNREHPTYLPAEACLVLPGQTIKRRLSPDQTQEMITFACRKPNENGDSIIRDGKRVLGLNPQDNAMTARFGLKVGASLITVAARVLNPPPIKYRDARSKETSVVPRFGSWNMANIKFHTGSNLGPWTCIVFRSSRGRDFGVDDVRGTVMAFKDFLIRSGINASNFIPTPPPPEIYLADGQEGQNDAKIKSIIQAMYAAKNGPRPHFILCVLPYNDVAIYNSIKNYADTKAGINTVCVVGSKFMKEQRQDQYFGNVSLKFNLKAGGINQVLDPAKLGLISEGKTMVVGLDVTHPSPGSKDTAPSVAGIVASVDKFLGQWPADFRIQESRKEMISGLEAMFLGRLNLWEKKNKVLPENIIIYRDGVSEGQYQLLLDQELPQIRNACRQKYPAQATKTGLPRISIIVCGKRHHTRFYPSTEANADRSSNCEPGTVVDRGVTEVHGWDFFIQPHACLQGTARPGHYYVVLDEIFRGRSAKPKPPLQNAADSLEDLTFNMCHLFGRATKAVSLCPPAYYADLLCTRLRCYLADQYDPNDSSASASVASGVTNVAQTFNIQIPESMKDSMFYI